MRARSGVAGLVFAFLCMSRGHKSHGDTILMGFTPTDQEIRAIASVSWSGICGVRMAVGDSSVAEGRGWGKSYLYKHI